MTVSKAADIVAHKARNGRSKGSLIKECSICQKKFRYDSDLKNHIDSHYRASSKRARGTPVLNGFNGSTPIRNASGPVGISRTSGRLSRPCMYCGARFPDKDALLRHETLEGKDYDKDASRFELDDWRGDRRLNYIAYDTTKKYHDVIDRTEEEFGEDDENSMDTQYCSSYGHSPRSVSGLTEVFFNSNSLAPPPPPPYYPIANGFHEPDLNDEASNVYVVSEASFNVESLDCSHVLEMPNNHTSQFVSYDPAGFPATSPGPPLPAHSDPAVSNGFLSPTPALPVPDFTQDCQQGSEAELQDPSEERTYTMLQCETPTSTLLTVETTSPSREVLDLSMPNENDDIEMSEEAKSIEDVSDLSDTVPESLDNEESPESLDIEETSVSQIEDVVIETEVTNEERVVAIINEVFDRIFELAANDADDTLHSECNGDEKEEKIEINGDIRINGVHENNVGGDSDDNENHSQFTTDEIKVNNENFIISNNSDNKECEPQQEQDQHVSSSNEVVDSSENSSVLEDVNTNEAVSIQNSDEDYYIKEDKVDTEGSIEEESETVSFEPNSMPIMPEANIAIKPDSSVDGYPDWMEFDQYSDLLDEDELEETKSEVDDDPTRVDCRFCGMIFKDGHVRKFHEQSHADDETNYDDGEDTRTFCGFCGKDFKNAKYRKIHENMHTGDLPVSCQHCGKRFRWESEVKTHQRLYCSAESPARVRTINFLKPKTPFALGSGKQRLRLVDQEGWEPSDTLLDGWKMKFRVRAAQDGQKTYIYMSPEGDIYHSRKAIVQKMESDGNYTEDEIELMRKRAKPGPRVNVEEMDRRMAEKIADEEMKRAEIEDRKKEKMAKLAKLKARVAGLKGLKRGRPSMNGHSNRIDEFGLTLDDYNDSSNMDNEENDSDFEGKEGKKRVKRGIKKKTIRPKKRIKAKA